MQTVKKRTMFWSLPTYMMVVIKRFNNQLKKLGVHVDIPLVGVSFEKYVCGYNSASYVYDVYGVCVHRGGVNSGHYYCNVLGDDGRWRQMNDTSVRIIEEGEVVDANAYCIFYRKRG
jgi:ubiquitin C-terminal hydrolase